MTMRETQAEALEAAAPFPGPRGVGTGVTFDWALTAQLTIMALCFVGGVGPGAQFAHTALIVRLGAAFFTLVAAALLFIFGEALRRGIGLARYAQIVFNAALTLAGLVSLVALPTELRGGHISALIREIILVGVSPLIVWLLTREQTRRWYAQATMAQARVRHSGARWYALVIIPAILGGAAIAFQSYY